jgi:tRNA U34 5-methylaminomethyl-2-thiouridine-forming methyltransferase MnmC
MADQRAKILWPDGAGPVSAQFDDPYFSVANGLDEARHVFLAGNGLPNRFKPDFQIAELGFGTGLNMLAAWQAWDDANNTGTLKFTSFEAFPMAAGDMARALAAFPSLADRAELLLDAWREGLRDLSLPGIQVSVIVGDAREAVPLWQDRADAWFLDGFSPAKNPELWESSLMDQVGIHTNPGGSFATYTAAGHVRAALSAARFDVSRVPGHGRKRHMTIGKLESAK